MSVGAAGPHFGGDPDRFHQPGRAAAYRRPRMPPDAVGALGDMGDGNGNQLLGLRWQGAVRKDALAKRIKGRLDIGSEIAPLAGLGPELPPWCIVKERRATFAALPAEQRRVYLVDSRTSATYTFACN